MEGLGITAQIPKALRKSFNNVRLFEDDEWHDLLPRESFGPEVGFSLEISFAFPNDKIVLCKVARGGANLYYDWNPDGISKGLEDEYRGPLYPKIMTAINKLKKHLSFGDELWEISGLIWMQGERDATFKFMSESYGRNLAAFVAAVRKDTANPELPLILGQIAPRVYIPEEGKFQHPFRNTVQEAQRQFTRIDPFAKLVETVDLPQSDNLHFDTGGQIELGKRFAQAYLL